MTAWQVLAMLVGGIVLIYLVSQFLRDPGMELLHLVRGAIIGIVAIVLINLVGEQWGVHIALNPITVGVCALLSLPGVAALAVINVWLV